MSNVGCAEICHSFVRLEAMSIDIRCVLQAPQLWRHDVLVVEILHRGADWTCQG